MFMVDRAVGTNQAEIDELLEYVGRMRAIGIQSRKVRCAI